MEGDEVRVEEREGEDGQNVLKMSTWIHELLSTLLSSPSMSLRPRHTLKDLLAQNSDECLEILR
jgi:hypothetical protein